MVPTARQVCEQISRLTIDFIKTGLCDDANFPQLKPQLYGIEEVSIIGKMDTSLFLKNIPYDEMYKIMKKERAYNFKMIDGALILLHYRFQKKEILAHRLSFFPSPNLLEFQNEPELYIEDEVYADMLDKQVVTVPLRFDFDNSEGTAKRVEHPISHLTIGQYKNCRIPVSAAITPYFFLSFLMKSFYHTANQKYGDKLSSFGDYFRKQIFEEDLREMHMYTPCGD
jgi:hypothetical protein